MKYIFLLSTLILSFSFSMQIGYSQDVFIGKEQRFSLKSGRFDIIGIVENKTYVYRSDNQGYFLEAYNDSMKLLATIHLDFLPEKVEDIKFINYPNKILVLYRHMERNTLVLSGAVLDEKGLIINGRGKKLDEEKVSILQSKSNLYEIAFSEDRSKVVVISRNSQGKEHEFKILTVSDELDILERKTIKVLKDEIGKEISLDQIKVANNGTVVLPTFSLTGRGSIQNASLLIFTDHSNDYRNIAIGEAKSYFADLIIQVDNHFNKCNIVGLLKENNNGNVIGIHNSKIDITNQNVETTASHPFPEAFLKIANNKNWKKFYNNGKLQQYIVKSDGSFVLIIENQHFQISNSYTGGYYGFNSFAGPGMGTSVKEYNYGDISVLNYDKDGTLLWSEFVRKNQYSQDDNGIFSSYAFLNTGGNLIMIFNSIANRDNVIEVAAIDNQGILQKANLSGFNLNLDWIMKAGKQISNKGIIVPVLGRNNINFLKVQF